MNTSAFCFAGDLADEGLETVLDNIQGRAGLGGVTMAAAYHASRDLFPHARTRRLRFQPGGEIFFRPDPARWRGLAIQPRPSRLTQDSDPLAELVAAAATRGLGVQAWTVFLHVDWTEDGDPRFAEQTCFGDPCLTELCPANPDVRAYALALAQDIAGRGVASVLAESLHHHALEHGAHHERYFVELGSAARLLLGLCFCDHCLAAAGRHGADPGELRRRACAEVERAFAGDDAAVERRAHPRGGRRRCSAASSARCWTRAARPSRRSPASWRPQPPSRASRFELLDGSGAAKGYAHGPPRGRPGAVDRLAHGHRRRRLRAAPEPRSARSPTPPTRPASRSTSIAYRALAPDAPLVAALRPVAPDCDSAENLAAKLRAARDAGRRPRRLLPLRPGP